MSLLQFREMHISEKNKVEAQMPAANLEKRNLEEQVLMAKTEVKMKEDDLKFQAAVRSNEAPRILVTRASLVPYVSTTWKVVQQRSPAEIQMI